MRVNERVYIDARSDGRGGWLAMSSPTAITVRRVATVVAVNRLKGTVTVRFDDGSGTVSDIKAAFVRPLTLAMEKAQWARVAVRQYFETSQETLRANDGPEEAMTCLVAAIGHLCDAEGLDYAGVLARAAAIYQGEQEGE